MQAAFTADFTLKPFTRFPCELLAVKGGGRVELIAVLKTRSSGVTTTEA